MTNKKELFKKLIIALRDEDVDLLNDTNVGGITAYDLLENATVYHAELANVKLNLDEDDDAYDKYAASL